VYRYSSGTYLEDQDMWRLSGIFRNVTLWSAPPVHIRDFFVKTPLDADYKNATVQVSAKVKNFSDQAAPARQLMLQVYDAAGKAAAQEAAAEVPALQPGEEKTVALKVALTDPAKWTAETPNLYTTVLKLSGQPDEYISTRTGIRQIEIKGRLFCVNGTPIKLKGANRHENWPETGHYVPEDKMIRDLEVLKQANCNHVRTCHYSDDPRWYELCDQYGIYLVAEANVECHGYYNVLDREPRYCKAIVDRNVANVENFKNHASVIIWSLGNECGGGDNFRAALAAIKAIDDRPTHYEPFGIGANNPADLDSNMYNSSGGIVNIAKDANRTKPYYLCEYAHAMNNSMGSIGEYNDAFDAYPELLGGAIWEWQDQGIWNRRDPKHPILAYGGGFGEVPNDHYFIHKGVVFSDRSPKPHYPEAKRAYQWIGITAVDVAAGQVRIKNKYQFINLAGFAGHWTLAEDGAVVEQGDLAPLDLAPGAEAAVTIPFKKTWAKAGAEYFLRIGFALTKDELWAKAGYELAAGQFVVPLPVAPAVATVADMKPVTLSQDATQITVKGDGFAVVFDKAAGGITQLVRNEVNMLAPGGGPTLHLWRAPHRIDDEWAFKDWHACGLDALQFKVLNIKARQIAPAVVHVGVALEGTGNNRFAVSHSAAYTIYGDGSVVADNGVIFQGQRIPLARLGVRLLLDKRLDQFAFLGRGPMENYADRKRGADVGLYTSSVKEQVTPYAKPMENGNKEDVRWAAVTGQGLPGLLAQATGELLQVSANPWRDEEMVTPEYTIDLPESTATVLTLATRTLGAGSAACGPRPLDQYIVYSDPATFSYTLRLLPPGQKEIPAIGRIAAPADRVKPVLSKREDNGSVSLSCATPAAKMEYSLDGATWQPYTAPLGDAQVLHLHVRACAGNLVPFESVIAVARFNPRAKWKVVATSSFERGEGDPAHIIDDNPGTFWHSRWKEPAAKPPHFVVLDFARSLHVTAVLYTARQDKNTNGCVKDYAVYFSDNPKKWPAAPAAQGRFDDAEQQTITLPHSIQARYMKFVVLSERQGQPFAAIAELDVKSTDAP